MGMTSKITLDPKSTPGIFHVEDLTPESADIASRLLQANRANHIFTTEEKEMGLSLHNHIVYHTLALFSLGASPKVLLAQTKRNSAYQLVPPKFSDEGTVREMEENEAALEKYIGKEEHFLDFVEYFERRIARDGQEKVLQDCLLGDTDLAKSIYPRLWHGYVHAIMHVGLGLEYKQGPILAEGLAEAAIHHDWWYTNYIEAAAAEAKKETETTLSLVQILDECLKDKVITTCSSWDYIKQWEPPTEDYPDGRWFVRREPYRDGVVGLALEPLSKLAARWRVGESDDLERATAELINASIYIAASAQRAPHEPRYDFFLIHGCNACLWHSVYLKESSITRAQKARLIETSGRMLFFLWAGMGAPKPDLEHLMSYKPKVADCDWNKIFQRACIHEDDGHMIKLIRALAHGEQISCPYDDLPEFRVKQHMFLHAASAALDSASEQPMVYIQHRDLLRLVGFPEAWENVPIMNN